MFSFNKIQNQPLSALSTFGIGGNAKTVYQPEDRQELLEILEYLHQEKTSFGIIALGSNIVFPDQGIDYPLIQIKSGVIVRKKATVIADAGVRLSDLVDFYLNKNLAGLEKFSGIPGSVGGAVVGNAGAYGESIGDYIINVEVWQNSHIKLLTEKECRFSYRHSIFKEERLVVLSVELKTVPADGQRLRQIAAEIIHQRQEKYHPGLKCPGSFFKNIPIADAPPSLLSKIDHKVVKGGKIPAGYLLESVGAKNLKVGGISIASYHGNLFINDGRGKAAEVKQLAQILKDKVRQKYGVVLEEEIRYF